MPVEAKCTWGVGPDVMLVNNQKGYVLYKQPTSLDKCIYGISYEGSIELCLDEAKALIISLQEAVENVEKLEKSYAEYIEKEESNE
jgi:hypothetical protein